MKMSQDNRELMKNLTEAHEQSGYLTPTTNNAGWQINALDEYGELFIEYAKSCRKPILDLGVAFGYTSKRLLETGATVVANDISADMLGELEKSVSPEEKKRLVLKPGNVMELQIQDGSFDGIWANRFLHFLTPEEIRTILPRFYKWLAPGGKLCITAASPYFLECDFERYSVKKNQGDEWPGFQEILDPQSQYIVPFTHWLESDVLERETKRVGFQVQKCSYIPRPYATTNGKEGVGIIAIKPE